MRQNSRESLVKRYSLTTIDIEGRLTGCSAVDGAFTSPDEVIGTRIGDLAAEPGDSAEHHLVNARVLFGRKPVWHDFRWKAPSGVCRRTASIGYKVPGKTVMVWANFESRDDKAVLTPQELSILNCLSEGKGFDQCARQYDISLATAKAHARSARVKLGAKTTTAAVARAIRCGLI